MQHPVQMNGGFETVFLALQGLVVAFLLLHDWIPLGRLSNLGAIESEDSLRRRIFVTLLPAVPTAIGLYASAERFGRAYPNWLELLLWITYGTLVAGISRGYFNNRTHVMRSAQNLTGSKRPRPKMFKRRQSEQLS